MSDIRVIQPCHKETAKYYRREFQTIGAEPGLGYAFPSDEHGCVDVSVLCDAARINYEKCLACPDQYEDQGVHLYKVETIVPAKAVCSHCGRYLYLNGDSRCQCGWWYNQWGQELVV